MSEAPTLALDFVADDSRVGFRLQRLEVLNWGTFDGCVWTLRADGRNALLTGDIGSGKSTLVDALTTLLVPSHRVAYNKAAGADARERTLRSYVLGHYKAERNDLGGTGRFIAVDRDPDARAYFDRFARGCGAQARFLRGDFATVLASVALGKASA